MIVISDTTPIISLLKINHLDSLEKLFGSLQIPKGIFAELTEDPRYQDEAKIVKESKFIQIVEEIDESYVTLLRRSTGLDLGESEAIYLSDNGKADLLLMDEVRGREVATRMGIRIMGTIGILGIAYEDSLISKEEIKNAVEILRDARKADSRDSLREPLLGECEKTLLDNRQHRHQPHVPRLQLGLPYVVLHNPRPFDTTTLNYNWQIWETNAFPFNALWNSESLADTQLFDSNLSPAIPVTISRTQTACKSESRS